MKKLKKKIKAFQKLSKRSLKKGNENDGIYTGRHKYKFGEVLIAYDKKQHSKATKPWYLYYPKTDSYTGGFKSRKEAVEWYEKKGR